METLSSKGISEFPTSQKYTDFLILDGSEQEISDLRQLLDIYIRFPTGQKLVQQLRPKHIKQPLHLQLNPKLYGYGQYQTGTDTIQLLPYTKKVQKKFPTQKEYATYILTVLAHEMRHASLADLHIQMIQNAQSIQDLLLVTLLDESAAYLTQQNLQDEIHNQPSDTNIETINSTLQNALSGKGWAKEYIQKTMAFYEEAKYAITQQQTTSQAITEREIICAMQKGRYPMPSKTDSQKFQDCGTKFLKEIGVTMTIQEVQNHPIPIQFPDQSPNPLISQYRIPTR